jgi:PAS domain S-box-containing protein
VTHDERRAVVYGLIVTGAFVGIDIALGRKAAISGSYALGAIVTGVIGGFRPALFMAGVVIALAAASGAWNMDFAEAGYFARLFVAVAGALLALGAGRLRDEVVDQLGRQAMLMAVADLPAPGASLQQTVARVTELLVPRYARFAAIDAQLSGELVRLGSRGTETTDPAASIVTPLRARGRAIGVLSISDGRGGADNPEFQRVFAGRVALALDNAGLSQELVSVEQQLEAILENLGEAVTVQDRSGQLVFANRAAAELLGAASVEELVATPPEELVGRFTTVNEDGSPVDLTRLPGRLVLEGREAEPLVLRATDNRTGEQRWRMTKSTAVHSPQGDVLLAVNVIEDITETKRSEMAQRLLADASSVLASSVDYASTLQQVAELTVPRLADWCSVILPDRDLLEPVAIAHADPELRELAHDYARRWQARVTDPQGSAKILRTGEPLLIPELTPDLLASASLDPEQLEALERLGLFSLLAVPMATPERTAGVLTLGTGASRRRFTASDCELALELGRRAATAIENARLYTQLERVATTLQSSLLPPELPDVPGWRFHSLYEPAGGEADVGGDFYDVFPTASGWMAVMGDVAGRGPAAASLTAMGRYTLRTAGSLVGTPTLGLARLNDHLRERGGLALCTAAVLQFPNGGSSRASLVCAGHPLPYLIRAGQVRAVGRTGPLLGAFEHAQWPVASLELQSGDVLVLYTDGVLDARGAEGRFGESRLETALVGTASADEAVERIQAELLAFAGIEQDDDLAILAMQKV